MNTDWGEHHAALSRLAVRQTLMVNQLVDMEWKFGVTVGTSEIQKVGNIFLQLKLVVRRGNSTENVYMELTLPQFYNFLHEMERAKASMECFS
uniref:COMM domain containing 7 n=1 Tax=Scophthalmus maximus TaxID=52904 RepID=A0A8D3C9Q4_SCOMX